MPLDTTNMDRTMAQFMREVPSPVDKVELRKALEEADVHLDSVLPAALEVFTGEVNSKASNTFKSLLYVYLIERRTGRLVAEED